MIQSFQVSLHYLFFLFAVKLTAFSTVAYVALYKIRVEMTKKGNVNLEHVSAFAIETMGLICAISMVFQWFSGAYDARLILDEQITFFLGCVALFIVILPKWKDLILRAWTP